MTQMRDKGFKDLGSVKGPEGKWVVVRKDRVVASSDDIKDVLKMAEEYPDDEIYITKILHPGASFY